MEFYIKKNATLPVLKMMIVKDGRSDYMRFMESLETSTIYFSMIEEDTGFIKISSAECDIVNLDLPEGSTPQYYIYFKFSERDTDTVGRYKGQFLVSNEEGELILPLREELYINIQDSFISKTACC